MPDTIRDIAFNPCWPRVCPDHCATCCTLLPPPLQNSLPQIVSSLASFECRARAMNIGWPQQDHLSDSAFYIYSQFWTLYAFTARWLARLKGPMILSSRLDWMGWKGGREGEPKELHNGGATAGIQRRRAQARGGLTNSGDRDSRKLRFASLSVP